ncbi:YpmS family protein [Metabacillus sp. SLBN-84]
MGKWKLAFIVLLTLNLVFLLFLAVSPFLPAEQPKTETADFNAGDTIPLTVSSSKNDLNRLINYYLVKEAKAEELNYKVLLENKVNLYGSVKAFGKDVDLTLSFEPQVNENGNMLLKVERLSIGRLPIPVPYVMSYIKKTYPLPEYVYIDPKQESVTVQITELKLKNNLKAKAESFNLKNDDIRFKLFVPADFEK